MVDDTFNISDLSPYLGEQSDEEDHKSRTTLSQGGGDDVDLHPSIDTQDTPIGPMTRARAKAIQEGELAPLDV